MTTHVMWLIMLSNIFPQMGHVTKLSNFVVYAYMVFLWGEINLPLCITINLDVGIKRRKSSLPKDDYDFKTTIIFET